jgi:lipopolysaccharide export LptBFGC system permease protein LptF
MAMPAALREVFPTNMTAYIFVGYIMLFVNMGLLVTASKSGSSYAYNPVTVVFLTEMVKLLASIFLYLRE